MYDVQINPCIDIAVVESEETDNRKIATRLRNHFIRILLAWWKAAHYVYSADTRLFYRRALLHLITEDGKLYDWPAFITGIHIDADNVTNKKDNPRIWFEYKPCYEFLKETEAGEKATVTVQSFSTKTAPEQTPTPKRRRPDETTADNNSTNAVGNPNQDRPPRQNRVQATQNGQGTDDALARKLYSTPIVDRRNSEETIIDQFMNAKDSVGGGETEREMLAQLTNSGRRLKPHDPRVPNGKTRVQIQ